MADLLSAFLLRGAVSPFVWGASDCCLWASDWVALCRGRDPAASLRGRYRTQRGAAMALARRGGMDAVVASLAAAAGLPPTTEPMVGDIGLIDTMRGRVLAVRVSMGWAWKGDHGVAIVPAAAVAAWRVDRSDG